ncbi:PssD/Cps14F family polysaccharide biosynthesis glycosyltransferase [Haloarcula onubensis]|uniref:UDP-N-acetylglucosamine transferase subunit ALG14 n=1 Tax=Haloarcula onubensis TaxID=2950539 RepID=A0ABU2FJ53_9EURY|nr:PssD/Cps14F family polysaccharide biosynthesis glycosyltransferase [Halomicroarcula sp. S3CR25-11]MDS0280790.1 UDP-N-acetylglucosamine transferase subunit ALG14 [Halomicroarcula sp. S3CR25-11]
MVSSHGGHLTELRMLADAFAGHDLFYVTYESERTSQLDIDPYTVENIGTSPVSMATAFGKILRWFWAQRPDVVVSTGSEIAIPAFVVGQLFGATTIFVESWCRVTNRSATGKLVYPFVDHLFVQWPELLDEYGEKAEFQGSVV